MIILAPMAGVTDLAFRLIVKDFGCDFMVSEMISAQGLIYNSQNTKRLLTSDPRQGPWAVQLFGHDPQTLAAAAKIVVQECQPDMIDLNMGCPTPKIVKNQDGAALLRQPKLVEKIVSRVVKAVDIPVTVKIRLGWDEFSINCVEIAQRIEAAGAYWITLHGRTRNQFYGGKARWDYIAQVKKKVSIPVVGNGDINNGMEAQRMLRETGCDHIMIGRGALGRPWLLHQVKTYLKTGNISAEPSIEKRFTTALNHLKLKIQFIGEAAAVREMRAHLAWYLKTLPESRNIRGRMNQVTSYSEVKLLLEEYKKDLLLLG